MGNMAMGNGYVYTAVTDKTQHTQNILAFSYLQCLDVYVTASMTMITNLDYRQNSTHNKYFAIYILTMARCV